MICFAYCPESAMSVNDRRRPAIDMENCKGCLICYRECSTGEVQMKREVHAI